jgi:hypothetical protein
MQEYINRTAILVLRILLNKLGAKLKCIYSKNKLLEPVFTGLKRDVPVIK